MRHRRQKADVRQLNKGKEKILENKTLLHCEKLPMGNVCCRLRQYRSSSSVSDIQSISQAAQWEHHSAVSNVPSHCFQRERTQDTIHRTPSSE